MPSSRDGSRSSARPISRESRGRGDASVADGPIAQVFILAHADPTRISEAVRPFLSQPGGYIQAEAGQKLLIVGDYPSVIRRVDALIKKLDADAPPLEIHFVSLKDAEATAVAPAVGAAHRQPRELPVGKPGPVWRYADGR